MEEFYLLDENLQIKYLIDVFSSSIWTNGYNTSGDCELAIEASTENLKKIQECKYIIREDDDKMACTITNIELDTDEENGDKLIIKGTDTKEILNQRIVAEQTNFSGLVEDYIRELITDSIISPSNSDRKISNFKLADKVGFTETISEQTTYDYVGEKIQELCQQYGWGYKVIIEDGYFVFYLYEGEDKSEYVEFSPDSDNISTTSYSQDNSNIKNVAIVAGEGEGTDRVKTTIGEGEGIDRYELYVDARDVSSTVDYDELVESYPDGTEVTKNDVIYYQVDGVNIAILTKDDDGEVTTTQLCDDTYEESLKSRGYEKMTDYTSVTSFSGEIIEGYNYTYKEDYNLGDIVMIKNEYGISAKVRITEITECYDENGYTMEPTFENIEE